MLVRLPSVLFVLLAFLHEVAASDDAKSVAHVDVQPAQVTWHPVIAHEHIRLTITAPDNTVSHYAFDADTTPTFLYTPHLLEGDYRYTLTLFAPSDIDEPGHERRRALQTGMFAVRENQMSLPSSGEAGLRDVVKNDDVIARFSLCAGAGCQEGESFGFSTVILHENSVRLWFDDTSTEAGDPANDWRIVINDAGTGSTCVNDNTCGTAEYFGIEDRGTADLPQQRSVFRVMAASPTSALYVEDTGEIGLGTDTPEEHLHIRSSSRPGIKLEHTGTSDATLVTENNGLRMERDFTADDRPLRIHDTGSSTDLLWITGEGRFRISGSLAKASGSFKIDHPLDPENKYLYHSFVESPDMMNVYNGNVTTDTAGFATVTLPGYFEALNQDFRYQLTVIGTFADAIVAEEIESNQFVIRTSEPNVKVSWQVTGVRHDPWAEAHRIQVEPLKPDAERATSLHAIPPLRPNE